MKLLLAVVLTIFATPSLAAPTTSASSGFDGYVIVQQHIAFGPLRIYLTENAAKIAVEQNKTTVTARAPSWNVLIYSATDRAGYAIPFDRWMREGIRSFAGHQELRGARILNLFDAKLKLKTVRYKFAKHSRYTGDAIEGILMLPHSGGKPLYTIGEEFTYTTSLPVSKKCSQFIHGLFKTPSSIGGIPLSYEEFMSDGQIKTWYSTVSIERKKIDPKFLDYPASFKKAKSEDELMWTGKRKEQADDFFGGLLDMEEPAKGKK
ncbi:MAG TPA: hypothetical protein V6D17_06185 [Candidatus Obscuribacterales bacterium]